MIGETLTYIIIVFAKYTLRLVKCFSTTREQKNFKINLQASHSISELTQPCILYVATSCTELQPISKMLLNAGLIYKMKQSSCYQKKYAPKCKKYILFFILKPS